MFYQITEIINVGSSIITTYINMILLFQEIFASNIEVANNFIIIPEIPERLTKSSIESNSGLLTSEHFFNPSPQYLHLADSTNPELSHQHLYLILVKPLCWI